MKRLFSITMIILLLLATPYSNISTVMGHMSSEENSMQVNDFTVKESITEDIDESAIELSETEQKQVENIQEKEALEENSGQDEEKTPLKKNVKQEQDSSATQVTNKNKGDSGITITPFSGNLNVDIDISPYRETVLAGNDAMYNLVFKVTGSKAEYTNAKVVVDLPITTYTDFSQDLSELKIDGVEPTYDTDTHQLIYLFDRIKPGRTYETIIKVNTENGHSPNGAQLTATASFEADNQPQVTDDALVKVNAASSISVTKQYKETRLSGVVQLAPFPGSYTIWDIKVSIPKKDVGQMFIKEGSKIRITDTFTNGLTYYDVMDNTPEPTRSNRTLTWEFDAPTLAQQVQAEGDFYTIDLRVRLQVNTTNTNPNIVGTTQQNNVSVSATFIDDKTITASAQDSIIIVDRDSATGDITGTIMYPSHLGPADGNAGIASQDLKDPNPPVYEDAYLQFRHGILSMRPGKDYDMLEYRTEYTIDPNLIFNSLRTPGNFYLARTQEEFSKRIRLAEEPTFNIVARVNGELVTLITNAEQSKEYNRHDLNLLDTDDVTEIRYVFTNAPKGMYANHVARYNFTVKPGYIGEVENHFNVRIVPDQRAINSGVPVNSSGVWWYKSLERNTWDRLSSERHATIVPRPTNQSPIATVAIALLNHDNGEVVQGSNRMKVTLTNSQSSPLAMKGPLESVVLLPLGVTLNANPNATYTDTNGNSSIGQYEIVDNNYNGSGRQLVKIGWDDSIIRIGKDLTAELDVIISASAPKSLQFDVYGFSGESTLRVPSTSGNVITNTVLQTDEGDLNGNDNMDEPRLKSGNIYLIRGQYDLQTEKLVKGALDEEFSYFGHTTPDGSIDYQVKLTNTTGATISNMVLMDVLPSVGDIGITDNIERGSKFTPKMTGPIVLPSAWENKVDVVYSTVKNPERNDLTKNTVYPDTTTKLTNPEGAANPNWMTESQVTDWSSIHSFKIELKEDAEWIEGDDMMIQFSMKAPSENEVDREVLDSTIDPTARASWNSFAVATDHGQPVEPLQVGVYMDFDIEESTINKTINGDDELYELENRDEEFTWKVDYTFSNYTGDWESVVLSDQINDILEITEVQVVDENDNNVIGNGNLTTSDNLVKFEINKQNGSYAFLANQTYKLVIKSKIKALATDEDLEPFIIDGGVPNTGELVINDEPEESNIVKVIPPIKGSIHLTKVSDNDETLEGATFDLYVCPTRETEIETCERVKSGTSNHDGVISYADLPLGHYKLVEKKAPEGYNLLTKPIDVDITEVNDRHIELTVKNSKVGWELPDTGGIGTVLYYGIGAILMVGALSLRIRRKKYN